MTEHYLSDLAFLGTKKLLQPLASTTLPPTSLLLNPLNLPSKTITFECITHTHMCVCTHVRIHTDTERTMDTCTCTHTHAHKGTLFYM